MGEIYPHNESGTCWRDAINDRMHESCGDGVTVPEDEAIRMGTDAPQHLLGILEEYGVISQGRHADMVVVDNQFNVKAVFRDGERLV